MTGKNLRINYVIVALNVLYVKKEKIYPAYISKQIQVVKKQVIILMIPNGEG